MTLKTEIQKELSFLLGSAKDRNTAQGQLVCKSALEALERAQSPRHISAVLHDINTAFVGIEAYGHLTSDEFRAVTRLRQLSANNA